MNATKQANSSEMNMLDLELYQLELELDHIRTTEELV